MASLSCCDCSYSFRFADFITFAAVANTPVRHIPSLEIGMACRQTVGDDSAQRHCEERSNPVYGAYFWIASQARNDEKGTCHWKQ